MKSEYGQFASVGAVAEPSDPERRSGELTMLTEFLDFYRTVLLRKASGLTPLQLAATVAASTLTIGRLIRHMTLVEDHWFDGTFAGLPEREPWSSADWDADRDGTVALVGRGRGAPLWRRPCGQIASASSSKAAATGRRWWRASTPSS